MQPQTSELDALRDSAVLLKFAAENIKDEKDLPQATVSTIAARVATARGKQMGSRHLYQILARIH